MLGGKKTFNFLFIGLLFWTDFVPWFGAASTFDDFAQSMRNGFVTVFTTACEGTLNCYLFAIFYTSTYLLGAVLIKYSEGSAYLVVVVSLTTPLGGLWWTLFQPSPFAWNPTWSDTTKYALAGLPIIFIGVVLYDLFKDTGVKNCPTSEKKPLVGSGAELLVGDSAFVLVSSS
jgi:hypothetical protein